MNFRHFNALRVFVVVADHLNMGRAADELNLSKGAISYQVQQLETALELRLFERVNRKLTLTEDGQSLLLAARSGFATIESEIARLTRAGRSHITIGMATYFASRWLSPRLMKFMAAYPSIDLRIYPLVDLLQVSDHNLDMLIRWGTGDWNDGGLQKERIFDCPAMLTASAATGRRIEAEGIEAVVNSTPLLHDREGSEAWADWFEAAGLEIPESAHRLVIQDPNVRAQAVIDGQGLALYDKLIEDEVENGRLYQYRDIQLENYGFYVLFPEACADDSNEMKFRNWLLEEGQEMAS
ncbi:MAG: LysR family transcriptional regulator [Pseudomonadota bacterium]